MPKITKGGVSNRLVEPGFIAEPGTPVEVAVDEGRPNVGLPSEEQPETHQGKALYATDDETTENDQDKPEDKPDPDPRAGTGQGATVGKAAPNVDSTEGPDAKRDIPQDKNQADKPLTSKNDGSKTDTAPARKAAGSRARRG